jgi:hypothetical protein
MYDHTLLALFVEVAPHAERVQDLPCDAQVRIE